MNIKDWKEEFNKKYDFSESKTLEYDNLLTIKDFIKELLSQSNQEIVKGKTNYHIYRNGDMVHIEHSKTDSSGIGFSVNQLDGIIQKLTKLRQSNKL